MNTEVCCRKYIFLNEIAFSPYIRLVTQKEAENYLAADHDGNVLSIIHSVAFWRLSHQSFGCIKLKNSESK